MFHWISSEIEGSPACRFHSLSASPAVAIAGGKFSDLCRLVLTGTVLFTGLPLLITCEATVLARVAHHEGAGAHPGEMPPDASSWVATFNACFRFRSSRRRRTSDAGPSKDQRSTSVAAENMMPAPEGVVRNPVSGKFHPCSGHRSVAKVACSPGPIVWACSPRRTVIGSAAEASLDKVRAPCVILTSMEFWR